MLKNVNVLVYLDIFLRLKVIGRIFQIEWIEPLIKRVIQSKGDVGFTSYGSRKLSWK